jgi:hypothetical protein
MTRTPSHALDLRIGKRLEVGDEVFFYYLTGYIPRDFWGGDSDDLRWDLRVGGPTLWTAGLGKHFVLEACEKQSLRYTYYRGLCPRAPKVPKPGLTKLSDGTERMIADGRWSRLVYDQRVKKQESFPCNYPEGLNSIYYCT